MPPKRRVPWVDPAKVAAVRQRREREEMERMGRQRLAVEESERAARHSREVEALKLERQQARAAGRRVPRRPQPSQQMPVRRRLGGEREERTALVQKLLSEREAGEESRRYSTPAVCARCARRPRVARPSRATYNS